MSGQNAEWAGLTRLTAVAFDAAQSRMALLRQRETALRATLAALDADRKAGGAPLTDDAAGRAGAALLWQRWVGRRREALNGELARTMVQIAAARTELARLHGRNQVAETLARDAQNAARALWARRSGD